MRHNVRRVHASFKRYCSQVIFPLHRTCLRWIDLGRIRGERDVTSYLDGFLSGRFLAFTGVFPGITIASPPASAILALADSLNR